jgi:hypothetical protein
MALAGGIIDGRRDRVISPIKRTVLVGPILERLSRALLERWRHEMQRDLLQAERGLGVIVGVAHLDTQYVAKSTRTKLPNMAAIGQVPVTT